MRPTKSSVHSTKMAYPGNCREINEELSADDLVRRLKDISQEFQTMNQDDDNQKYVPLAMYITNDYFLEHNTRDVRLLVACTIADVFRVYAPNAPYQQHDLIKKIFLFFIQQLKGLQDPKDPTFKRYFYLLENLAWVKSFNICFELEESQRIFCKLFSLIFRIINDNHSEKVKNFMLDMLTPLIVESDSVSSELLEIILWQIIEPRKTINKNAYWLATQILRKSAKAIEPYIIQYFTNIIAQGVRESAAALSEEDDDEFIPQSVINPNRAKSLKTQQQPKILTHANICDLIYELNMICPGAMEPILPQLEFKVKSNDEKERVEYSKLLARLFSDKQSILASKYPDLWKSFTGRFRDICVTVRMRCVQYSMHFLINHPELKPDITDQLRQRLHDPDEIVRHEVVMAIISAARKDLENVNVDLINFVKERTLDKKFKIRREALYGLAQLYKQYNVSAIQSGNDIDHPHANIIRSLNWIKNKTLHNYFQAGLEDRLLVEKIVNTCLIPHSLAIPQRMRNLYTFFCTVDANAARAFGEMLKQQLAVRKMVKDLLDTIMEEDSEERAKSIKTKVTNLTKLLPEPVKADEYLTQFCVKLEENTMLRQHMEQIVTATTYQQYTADGSLLEPANSLAIDISAREVLKSLGFPVQTNSYYVIVRQLMERVAPVLIDHDGLIILFQYVSDSLLGEGELDSEMALENSAKRGLQLIYHFSNVFPAIFYGHQIFTDYLLPFLWNCGNMPEITEVVLQILTNIGTYFASPLINGNGSSLPWWAQDDKVIPQIIDKFILEADTPKQAKYAIECLNSIILDEGEKTKVFGDILDKIKDTGLSCLDSAHFRMHLVAIGMISTCGGHLYFPKLLKTIVQKFVVQGLLLKDNRTEIEIQSQEEFEASNKTRIESGNSLEFCSEEVKSKIEGIKLMVRWLYGLKLASIATGADSEAQSNYIKMASNTMQLLRTIVASGGDLNEKGLAGSTLEKAHLRLSAGLAMIKICSNDAITSSHQAVDTNSGSIIQVTSTTCPVMSAQQWHSLSQLLMDGEEFVREKFALKLHKRLMTLSLGLEFLAMLSLAGTYDDSHSFRQKLKGYLMHNLIKRRDLIKTKQIANVKATMPDCVLPYVIHLLAHQPFYTTYDDIPQLQNAQECLWFALEPLVLRNDQFSFSFYKRTLENIKTCIDFVSSPALESTNGEEPADEEAASIATMTNYKIYSLCDLALGLVMGKTQNFLLKDFPVQPSLPSKYYKVSASAADNNAKTYLPTDMQVSPPKRCGLEAEILNKITKSFQAQSQHQQAVLQGTVASIKTVKTATGESQIIYVGPGGEETVQEGIVIEDESERLTNPPQPPLTSTPLHGRQRAIIVRDQAAVAALTAAAGSYAQPTTTVTPVAAPPSNSEKESSPSPKKSPVPSHTTRTRKQDLSASKSVPLESGDTDIQEPASKKAKKDATPPPVSAKGTRSTRAAAKSPVKETPPEPEPEEEDEEPEEVEEDEDEEQEEEEEEAPPPPPKKGRAGRAAAKGPAKADPKQVAEEPEEAPTTRKSARGAVKSEEPEKPSKAAKSPVKSDPPAAAPRATRKSSRR